MSIAKGFGNLVGTLYVTVVYSTLALAIISVLEFISGMDIIVRYDLMLLMISLGVLITHLRHFIHTLINE